MEQVSELLNGRINKIKYIEDDRQETDDENQAYEQPTTLKRNSKILKITNIQETTI